MIIADGPHPTGENKTFGVNDPCSTFDNSLIVSPSPFLMVWESS